MSEQGEPKQAHDPELYLTKTEAFVIDCRTRGMSDTAIRRLLQLSEAEAVALGLIPARTKKADAAEGRAAAGTAAPDPWPRREGLNRPFVRRPARFSDARASGRRRQRFHLRADGRGRRTDPGTTNRLQGKTPRGDKG